MDDDHVMGSERPPLKPRTRTTYYGRHPEKKRQHNENYLIHKFERSPELTEKLKGRIRNDFGKLTRILYDRVLPRKCAVCGTWQNLEIHHKRYVYPIVIEDLERLCEKHHREEHQKLSPSQSQTPSDHGSEK